MPDSRTKQIASYFGPERFTTCVYVYDSGDDWQHDLQLNDVVTLSDKFRHHLLGGEHAFPPDDLGDLTATRWLQRALATGKGRDGLLEWARGLGWTGEFDLDATRTAFERGKTH